MSKKLKLCNEICVLVKCDRKNKQLRNLTLEELLYIKSWINIASDLSNKINSELLTNITLEKRTKKYHGYKI